MGIGARVITAVVVLACTQAVLGAQRPGFRSGVELINLNVTVTGGDARPVQGLTADQFEVFEDGVRQDLRFFAPGSIPLDVVILLDTSASMSSAMPLVQSAAIKFAQALRDHDRATIMGIAGGLRVLQSLTGDKAEMADAIRAAKTGGRTPLYAAVYTALHELSKVRRDYDEPRRQAIVVLSDGQDTSSAFGYDELMDSVRRHGVPIYAIAPRPTAVIKAQREALFGETTHEADFELRRIATETGARAFFPVTLQDLSGIYDDIADELAHQYSLGYQSSNLSADGGFRRIGIRVNEKNVKWRTRAGYLVSGAGWVGSGAGLR